MPQVSDPNWYAFGVLLAYSAAVILASVLGGLLPEYVRLTHNRMQLMISFVGGIMLGIAVFHMIPHALVAADGNIDRVAKGVMLGLVATFFLLRFFHFHQHGPADFGISAEEQRVASEEAEPTHLCSEHNDPRSSHHHHHQCDAEARTGSRWIFVLLGLGLHTLTDGIAMASGVVSEAAHDPSFWVPGVGIFLAVLLHKPLDAVSITSLMHPVTTANRRLAVNIGFALMCPVGAFLFWWTAGIGPGWTQFLSSWGLAFSAGVFLCISLSDLLPEMEFHSHSRIPLSVALLLGIFAALGIGLLEGEHAHGHGQHGDSGAHVESHDHGNSHDHSH